MSIQPEEMLPEEKLGDFIARVRAARGMTIEQLSDEIKLGVSYVKAIEASDWRVFPVAAYVRGYLRSIGHKLNMDVDQMLRAYSAECGGPSKPFFETRSSEKIKLSPLKEDEKLRRSGCYCHSRTGIPSRFSFPGS
jgi:cytoskeletal protein RodZ